MTVTSKALISDGLNNAYNVPHVTLAAFTRVASCDFSTLLVLNGLLTLFRVRPHGTTE